jgi:hypothetical protein
MNTELGATSSYSSTAAEVEALHKDWLLHAKIVGLYEQIKRDDLERAKSVRWCAYAQAVGVSPTPNRDRACEALRPYAVNPTLPKGLLHRELAEIRIEQQADAERRAAMQKAAAEAAATVEAEAEERRLALKARSEVDARHRDCSRARLGYRRREPHRSGLKVGRPVARCTRGQGSASPPKEGNGSDSSGSDGAGPHPARRVVESVVVAATARCGVLDRVARTAIWDEEGLAEWLALGVCACQLLGEPS